MAGIPITFGFIGTTSRKRSANRFFSCTSFEFGSEIHFEMTANLESGKGADWSLTATAQTGGSPQRRKGRQGEQPGEEMEVKFLGLQSRSGFGGRLLIGLPILAFLVRRRIDRAGWGLLRAPGVPHSLQFLDFIGEGPRKIVRFA